MSDDIAQALAYIESATLNPIQVGLYSRAAVLSENKDRGKYLGEPGQDGAATVGGTLVSVLANLTGQNRTDVANSLEFASRVAAKEVGADDHTAAYWNAFKTSIFQIGWFKQADEWSSDFIDGTTTGAENFSDYVIDNVSGDPLYSSAEKDIVIRSLKSLRSQAEKRAFFRSFTAGGDKGSFGVNSATVTNGALAMRFSAFTFSCNAKVDDYLIFSIKNIKANVQKDNVDAAANQRTIDSVRQKIEGQIGQGGW
ncbi:32 kDa-cell wall symbiosis regulated acidic polypeptide [Pisolithus orientalis]|uniref:32 kDa-cell wall symbiosis regulated acidic polypeptide n=1 Tax=Pisolithus orientalis TaxID=936130 RepID=UPI002223F24A|nr:32 kDa-cell wall symbiosis regulated acidic polypeptide [Pisolithus orientalis]KAI6000420.1 32 kDa-cell wall symbiosis regulated acidic polypeptide [Pisolithus orientalis]